MFTSGTPKTVKKKECKEMPLGVYSRVVLWEKDVGELSEELSYKLV